MSYLTILGLSLTVVIAMQKGDSCDDSVRFKLSDADGHHICFLSVDAIRDAFLAVSDEKTSFVFGYNAPSYTALTSPIKVLVDVNALCFKGFISTGARLNYDVVTRDNIPGFSCFLSPSWSSVNSLEHTRFSISRRSIFYASLDSSAFPVRAGPKSFV